MQKNAWVNTISSLVLSAFCVLLRWLQNVNVFEEETGLAKEGAALSWMVAIAMLGSAAALWFLCRPLKSCNAPTEPELALADAPKGLMAVLGAAALGDIGKLFPDKDPAYEGISSLILLGKTNEALLSAGYAVSNCDVTIVCQKPKLAPYIEKMRVNIADTLKTDVMNVSVKATTTEHLGFEGAGEGISAQAAVLIRRVK